MARPTPRKRKTAGKKPSPASRPKRRPGPPRETAAAREKRRLAALRRSHDRRVAGLVQEIARLRHHEARTTALTRLLAERDRTLAACQTRIAALESLLQQRTELG